MLHVYQNLNDTLKESIEKQNKAIKKIHEKNSENFDELRVRVECIEDYLSKDCQ